MFLIEIEPFRLAIGPIGPADIGTFIPLIPHQCKAL